MDRRYVPRSFASGRGSVPPRATLPGQAYVHQQILPPGQRFVQPQRQYFPPAQAQYASGAHAWGQPEFAQPPFATAPGFHPLGQSARAPFAPGPDPGLVASEQWHGPPMQSTATAASAPHLIARQSTSSGQRHGDDSWGQWSFAPGATYAQASARGSHGYIQTPEPAASRSSLSSPVALNFVPGARSRTAVEPPVAAGQRLAAGREPRAEASGLSQSGLVGLFQQRWTNADESSAEHPCLDVVGAYQFDRLLGSGKFGRTFSAVHRQTGKRVALKLCSFRRLVRSSAGLQGDALDDSRLPAREDFSRKHAHFRSGCLRLEATIVRCLTGLSPFIADMAQTDRAVLPAVCDMERGELGYSTELMAADLITVWLYWEDACDDSLETWKAFHRMTTFVAAQLAETVRFLKTCGVVHHDINAKNVLVGRDGYVKLTDFGLAYVQTSDGFNPAPPTLANFNRKMRRQCGYNDPPEDIWQYLRRKELGDHAFPGPLNSRDIFSLGQTIWQLDYPVVINVPFNEMFRFDVRQPTFSAFAASFMPNRTPTNIRGELVDFVYSVMRPDPIDRLGHVNPEELIRHPAFHEYDFGLLRLKAIPPPMDEVLSELLRCGDFSHPSDYMPVAPWTADSAELRYCQHLTPQQKSTFLDAFTPPLDETQSVPPNM